MAVIPVDFAQINHFFTGAGAPRGAQVVYGVELLNSDTPSEVAQDCHEAWVATLLDQQSDAIALSSTLCKFGPNLTGPAGLYTNEDAGTVVSSVVTPNTAVLMKKVTNLGGRQHAGRLFMPGYTEADISAGGGIDATDLASLQTDATAFLDALVTAQHPMVILHNDALVTPTTVESLQVVSTVATQRRRLRG